MYYPVLYFVGELLPEVHNIWSPLTHRLIDTHIPVRMKVQCMCIKIMLQLILNVY